MVSLPNHPGFRTSAGARHFDELSDRVSGFGREGIMLQLAQGPEWRFSGVNVDRAGHFGGSRIGW